MKNKTQCLGLILFLQINVHSMQAPMQEVFSQIYETNWWGDTESASGTGSNLKQTEVIRLNMPSLLRLLQVRSILDAPCGDFFWMKEVDLNFLDLYVGADIVPNLIRRNNQLHGSNRRIFKHINIVNDPLPKTDLILCRDCLVHLEFNDCIKVIKNFKKSGAKYLLITTFTRNAPNTELDQNGWRTLNMQLPPFNFPQPFMLINENCSENDGMFHDKSLGLWRLDDITL